MQRILTVLVVALVMAAMLVATAMPAFADSGRNPAGHKAPGQSTNPNPGK
jgi:hypothetical protein